MNSALLAFLPMLTQSARNDDHVVLRRHRGLSYGFATLIDTSAELVLRFAHLHYQRYRVECR